jgi:hypothetical protein
MKDLTVILEDRPGRLAALGEATGNAGINIELVCTTFGEVRLVLGVDDIHKARAAV